jgi:acetyl-CoA acetyltransferase
LTIGIAPSRAVANALWGEQQPQQELVKMSEAFPRAKTAVVGASTFGLGEMPGWSSMELATQASKLALADSGLKLLDVDALFICTPDDYLAGLTFAESLGLRPKFTDNNRTGGSAFMSHVITAAMMLDAGMIDTALIAHGSNQRSGARAYAMAGIGPSDVDVVELYDAFTINTILFLEDLGFCPKGEGGRFVEGGAIAPGGTLPVNTNGGGLSCAHPGMYGLLAIVEAVRQLRGEAVSQIAGADVALAHGNGGTLSSQASLILSRHT